MPLVMGARASRASPNRLAGHRLGSKAIGWARVLHAVCAVQADLAGAIQLGAMAGLRSHIAARRNFGEAQAEIVCASCGRVREPTRVESRRLTLSVDLSDVAQEAKTPRVRIVRGELRVHPWMW